MSPKPQSLQSRLFNQGRRRVFDGKKASASPYSSGFDPTHYSLGKVLQRSQRKQEATMHSPKFLPIKIKLSTEYKSHTLTNSPLLSVRDEGNGEARDLFRRTRQIVFNDERVKGTWFQ